MRQLDLGASRLIDWLAVAGTLCHVLRDLAPNTFDFQAPGFYEKLGFEVFGVLADYPPGHKRFFMVKRLRER